MTTLPLDDFLTGLTKVARRRPVPSDRNREVHHQVRVSCRKQRDVAQEFGINQQRVSAICRQVDRWRAETNRWEHGELDGDARRKAERLLFRDRVEHVIRESFQLSVQSRQPIVTRKKGSRDGKQWNERSTRTTSGSGQHLKNAMAAMTLLHKLDESPSPPASDHANEHHEYLRWIVEALTCLRQQAEKAGLVAKTADPLQATVALVAGWIGGASSGNCSAYSASTTATAPAAESVVAPASDTTPCSDTTCDRAESVVEAPEADSLHPVEQPFTTCLADCMAATNGCSGSGCDASRRAPLGRIGFQRIDDPGLRPGLAQVGPLGRMYDAQPSGVVLRDEDDCIAATSRRAEPEGDRGDGAPTGQPAKALGAAQGSRSALDREAPSGRAESAGATCDRAPLGSVVDDPPARRMFRGRPLRPR